MNYGAKRAEALALAVDYLVVRLMFFIPFFDSLSLAAEAAAAAFLFALIYGVLPAAGIRSPGQRLLRVTFSGPSLSLLMRGITISCVWLPARLLAAYPLPLFGFHILTLYLVYIIIVIVYLFASYLSLKPSLFSWSVLVTRSIRSTS
ncbi:hypothetical protein ACFO4L_15915 [Bacillus daqingensis]|uniref:RDD family protein n=1 Tax=Bacillus daqingensis TaxID=872396 RepID=A0ABV9P191_9BACI